MRNRKAMAAAHVLVAVGIALLTAKTKELQKFVLRAVEDPEGFIVDEAIELHRQKTGEKKAIAESSAVKEGEAEAESEEGSAPKEGSGEKEEGSGAED